MHGPLKIKGKEKRDSVRKKVTHEKGSTGISLGRADVSVVSCERQL